MVEDRGAGSGSVAARLLLSGTVGEKKEFLGFGVGGGGGGDGHGEGKKLTFAEFVFYEWREGRIVDVKSLLDLEAVRKQLDD